VIPLVAGGKGYDLFDIKSEVSTGYVGMLPLAMAETLVSVNKECHVH